MRNFASTFLSLLAITFFLDVRPAHAINPVCNKYSTTACQITTESGGWISIYSSNGALFFSSYGYPTLAKGEEQRVYIDLYKPIFSWTSSYVNGTKTYSSNTPAEVTTKAYGALSTCVWLATDRYWGKLFGVTSGYVGDSGSFYNALASWDAFYSANAGYCSR